MDNETKIQSYLFVPANQARSLLKSKNLVDSNKTIRIIDLEDSIKNPTDDNDSENLKEGAREFLKEYLTEDNSIFNLRINNFRSQSFKKDIKLLIDLNKKIDLNNLCKSIVLPKTDSLKEINGLRDLLKENGLNIRIIPLIETINGVNNFHEITLDTEIKEVMFGHHDYFYDRGIFPIPNTALSSKLYREILSKMLNSLKGKNIQFIDGICPFLENQEIIKDNCRYLYQQNPELHFGKIVLNPLQVEAINTIDDWEKKISLNSEDDELNNDKKIKLAKETIELYKNRNNLKLGVGKVEGKYISPQQYYLSEKILKENDEKNNELNNFKIH